MAVKRGEMTVKVCSCSSAFQDARYGVGLRACNMLQGKGQKLEAPDYRCTVCGVVK